jgi:Icc-related predicted phosphoesterase
MVRLFFTTDVHASDRCFRKFLNASKFYKADCLILGGDITGKVLVPIAETADGNYELKLFGKDKRIKRNELDRTRKELQDSGQYSFVTTKKELAEVEADKTKEERLFNEAMLSVIRKWVELVEERLKRTNVTCYISPGNDDKFEIDSELVDKGHLVNPENRVVLVEGNEMITLGFATRTPWNSPREVDEDRLSEMIEKLSSKVTNPEKAIYNLHVPPINTELDKAPAVSSELEYVREGLGIKMIHAGSSAVRNSIERHQPLLGLHGHIHESRGFVRIGRTLCLNPGSEYSDGILRGCLVNLQDGKVKEFLLTSG